MKRKKAVAAWFRLLWLFLKVNLFSTSGPASIVLLYEESVDTMMSEAQFIEAIGFSNALPGSGALKLAMFVGYEAGGISGVFAAILGSMLPPVFAAFIALMFLDWFHRASWMEGFLKGLAPSVAMLMVYVAWKIFRGGGAGRLQKRMILIAALSLAAFFLNLPSPLVLAGAGILGVILFR
jgi:chromate transporter